MDIQKIPYLEEQIGSTFVCNHAWAVYSEPRDVALANWMHIMGAPWLAIRESYGNYFDALALAFSFWDDLGVHA